MKKVQSTCNYCALDCNLDFYVEDEKIVKIIRMWTHYEKQRGFLMSTVFDKIALGLEEAIAYEKGELEAKKTKVTVEPVTEFSASEIN